MRKVLIVAALMAGAALIGAAQASEDRARSEGSQPTARTESVRKDGERVCTAWEGRSHQSRESDCEARRKAWEPEEDEDRD